MKTQPLFENFNDQLTQELLVSDDEFEPDLMGWVTRNRKLANSITADAVRLGKAPTRLAALKTISSMLEENPIDDQVATAGDFKSGRTVKRSQYNAQRGTGGEADPHQRVGALGHQEMQYMLNGTTLGSARGINMVDRADNTILKPYEELKDGHQFSFYEMHQRSSGLDGWPSSSGLPAHDEVVDILRGDIHVPLRTLAKIGSIVEKAQLAAKEANLLTRFSQLSKITGELRPYLARVMGEMPLDKMMAALRDRHAITRINAQLVFAHLVLYAEKHGEQVIFSEVPPLPRNNFFNNWRVDAYVAEEVGGEKPSTKDRRKMNNYARAQRSDRGALARDLPRLVGAPVRLVVHDWKLGIGDGSRGEEIKRSDVVDEPIGSHANQVGNYVMLEPLAEALSGTNVPITELFAQSGERVGRIVYFLADSQPVTHDVVMSPARQETAFRRMLEKLPKAQQNSRDRKVENFVLGVIGAWERGMEAKARKQSRDPSYNLVMALAPEIDVLSDAIAHFGKRRYVDEAELIIDKGVNKKDEPVHSIDATRFMAALEAGDIETDSSFGLPNGGLIRCIDPDHEDSKPSTSVNLREGYVHCFVDGKTWRFEPSTIPSNMLEGILATRAARKGQKGLESYSVPDRMLQIMDEAQFLQNSWFQGSPAEQYLVEKRKLDPEIAWAMGAGFAQKKLVIELMERGFGYDELLESGIVKLGKRMNHPASVMNELGIYMDQKDIVRAHPTYDGPGYPYLMMGGPWENGEEMGRLTFPLQDHLGNTNSFYGRRIDGGDAYKHFKLTTPWSHGAFNSCVLQQEGERFLVESPLEALAIMEMMGTTNVMGMIGIRNFFIREMIMNAGGDWTVAFNNDPIKVLANGNLGGESGQRASESLLKQLQESGNDDKHRNLTAELLAPDGDPRFIGFNDYNDFLAYLKSPEYILSQIH